MTISRYPLDYPIIRPLLNDLHDLNIGSYLRTNNFRKFTVKLDLHDAWDKFYEEATNLRTIFSFEVDFEDDDCEAALAILFNRCYNQSEEVFKQISSPIIEEFLRIKQSDNLDVTSLIETLELLEFDDEVIEAVKKYKNYSGLGVPLSSIPNLVANAEQLALFLDKMNSSILALDYNLTLTYAYSCLEGLYKAYISNKMAGTGIPIELQRQATLVRDHIKDRLNKKNVTYPEQIINLIPTVTSALSNARNGYSASHFDAKAEKWLAEFTRDCVNSVARLIIEFID